MTFTRLYKLPALILSAIVLLFALCQQAQAYSISQQEINQYLAQKPAFASRLGIPLLFNLDYNLHDLSTEIGKSAPNKVAVSGTMDGLFNLSGQKFPAQLNLTFDTVPYYDAENGQIYLKDVRILRWSGSPQKYMDELQTAMPFISDGISALLSRIPIYTLDTNNPKEMLIKQFAKGIKVENGKLEIETKMF